MRPRGGGDLRDLDPNASLGIPARFPFKPGGVPRPLLAAVARLELARDADAGRFWRLIPQGD